MWRPEVMHLVLNTRCASPCLNWLHHACIAAAASSAAPAAAAASSSTASSLNRSCETEHSQITPTDDGGGCAKGSCLSVRQATEHDTLLCTVSSVTSREETSRFADGHASWYLERGHEARQRRQVRQVNGHQVEGDAGAGAEAVADDRHLGVPLQRSGTQQLKTSTDTPCALQCGPMPTGQIVTVVDHASF